MMRAHKAVLALLLVSSGAGAIEGGVKLEPGVVLPLGDPQDKRFGVGGGALVVPSLGITGALDLQLDAGLYALSPGSQGTTTGTALVLGAGARVKRPHASGSLSPWADFALLYARTGPLDRFAFAVGAGVHFPIAEARALWVGPFVRYLQIVEPTRTGFDSTDAKLLTVGETKPNAQLAPGELAAYSIVASVILNLDETITKE